MSVFVLATGSVYADQMDSKGVLHNGSGSLRFMTHYQAVDACPDGTHLPSIRELAKDSENRGAVGILKGDETPRRNGPAGYEFIYAPSGEGYRKVDQFWYNSEGLQGNGVLSNEFWSAGFDGGDGSTAFLFNGKTGEIYNRDRGSYMAVVRCFAD